MSKEALYYESINDNVKCLLCPNYCIIKNNSSGICRKRVNRDGKLYAENYAETISLCLDPMRKKPLYHFYPEDEILSLGANSCNLSCSFCQNYKSSQLDCSTEKIMPEDLIEIIKKHNRNSLEEKPIKHVAFTYTEPFTWYEYILDCAKLLKENDISVVLVTNGYVNPDPLSVIVPYIDAMNIDLKAFSDKFYVDICGGKLQPVLNTIEYTNSRTHIEITLLLIEGLNDNENELQQMFSFIAGINKNIPLHITRYYPRYKINIDATNDFAISRAKDLAKKCNLINVYGV